MAALREAGDDTMRTHPGVRVVVLCDYEFVYELRGRESPATDGHAGLLETSRVLALAPETVGAERPVAENHRSPFLPGAATEAEWPESVMGDTRPATAGLRSPRAELCPRPPRRNGPPATSRVSPEENVAEPSDAIRIRGARQRNLKNVSLDLPRGKFIVITGVSGSGKSSLAFDTLYAEGQRRYIESLSSYARQFLGQMDKPDVDTIDGLSPAIAIEQRAGSRNPRSTVGTVTEIYDYLRLLYARIGVPHCPNDGHEISPQSVEPISEAVTSRAKGAKVDLIAPVVRAMKGEHRDVLERLRKSGYRRFVLDGVEVRLRVRRSTSRRTRSTPSR